MTSGQKIKQMHKMFGAGEGRCRDCDNLICYTRDRNYYKCSVYGLSCSEATDWRVSNPACGMKNKEYDGNPVYKTIDHNRPEEQIGGQLNFSDLMIQ